AYFASNEWRQEATAFYLLAMSMHDEQSAPPGSARLGSTLLAEMLQDTAGDAGLPALSALLFFAHDRPAERAVQLVSALAQSAESQVPSALLRALSLLGKDAADRLALAMHNHELPETVRLEMTGLLGTLAEDEQLAAYVLALAAGSNGTATA